MDDDPRFEWNDDKAARNLAERGIRFDAIRAFDWDSCVTAEDTRGDYGERRFVSIGRIDGRLHVAVWTEREERAGSSASARPTPGKGQGMSEAKSYISPEGDALELDDAWFRKARRGRPPMLPSRKKVKVTIGLDPDVVAAAKAEGAGWQTRINATLRRHFGLE